MALSGLALLRQQMRFSPHLEEFIQIGRHNAQAAKALKQGHVFAVGPVKNPFVERKNAVVAVQQSDTAESG
jgi:hypothetical protein